MLRVVRLLNRVTSEVLDKLTVSTDRNNPHALREWSPDFLSYGTFATASLNNDGRVAVCLEEVKVSGTRTGVLAPKSCDST